MSLDQVLNIKSFSVPKYTIYLRVEPALLHEFIHFIVGEIRVVGCCC